MFNLHMEVARNGEVGRALDDVPFVGPNPRLSPARGAERGCQAGAGKSFRALSAP